MFQPNDKYTGKPNLFQKIMRVIFTIIGAMLMFGAAFIIFKELSDYEAGATIKMDGLLFLIYKMVGKWPIAIVFASLGVYIGYSSYKQMIADYKIDDEED